MLFFTLRNENKKEKHFNLNLIFSTFGPPSTEITLQFWEIKGNFNRNNKKMGILKPSLK